MSTVRVKAAYGPTLAEILGPRRWRLVVIATIVVVAIGGLVALRSGSSEEVLIRRGNPTYNFVYAAPLKLVGAAKVEETRGGAFVQSMDVLPYSLPAYPLNASGVLPVIADRLGARLATEHPGFRIVSQGRAQINDNPGYYIAWEGRLGARKLFGRDYLLMPGDQAKPHHGVRIELRSTYAGAVATADDVGRIGKLKQPLHSFRFGTERQ